MSTTSSSSTRATTLGSAPSGCQTYRPENFAITVQTVTTSQKRSSLALRNLHNHEARADTLQIQLTGGTMVDQQGRLGYVATNGQFQFNKPPISDQLYIGPFSICANSSIALGPTTNWYECLSGNFYNLYYFTTAANGISNCSLIKLQEFAGNSTTTSTATLPTSSPSIRTSATGAATTSTQAAYLYGSNTSSSLSGGAIAGIVIGAIVAILAVLAVIGYCMRKKRRQVVAARKQQQQPTEMEGVTQNAELEGHQPPVEAGSVPVSELPGSDVPPSKGYDDVIKEQSDITAAGMNSTRTTYSSNH